jgi:uncharacterized protein (DUF1330 family)
MAAAIWSAAAPPMRSKAVRRRRTIIVVEFPSMERLREWYASPEYAEALKHRHTALDRRLIFVEGVPTA